MHLKLYCAILYPYSPFGQLTEESIVNLKKKSLKNLKVILEVKAERYRQRILHHKAERFRKRIQSWAREEGLIDDAEEIEVTVQITGSKKLLQMPLEDLFTVERLQSLGCSKHLIGHIRHNLVGIGIYTRSPYPNRPFPTVGDLFKVGKTGLRERRHIGSSVLATVDKVFESIGLRFED